MLFKGWSGPQEKWQAELNKADKASLLSLIEHLVAYSGVSSKLLATMVHGAKLDGKYTALRRRLDRLYDDPEAALDRQIKRLRRQKAARRKAAKKGSK